MEILSFLPHGDIEREEPPKQNKKYNDANKPKSSPRPRRVCIKESGNAVPNGLPNICGNYGKK